MCIYIPNRYTILRHQEKVLRKQSFHGEHSKIFFQSSLSIVMKTPSHLLAHERNTINRSQCMQHMIAEDQIKKQHNHVVIILQPFHKHKTLGDLTLMGCCKY